MISNIDPKAITYTIQAIAIIAIIIGIGITFLNKKPKKNISKNIKPIDNNVVKQNKELLEKEEFPKEIVTTDANIELKHLVDSGRELSQEEKITTKKTQKKTISAKKTTKTAAKKPTSKGTTKKTTAKKTTSKGTTIKTVAKKPTSKSTTRKATTKKTTSTVRKKTTTTKKKTNTNKKK